MKFPVVASKRKTLSFPPLIKTVLDSLISCTISLGSVNPPPLGNSPINRPVKPSKRMAASLPLLAALVTTTSNIVPIKFWENKRFSAIPKLTKCSMEVNKFC